jgi:hypothetical protein
MSLFFRPPRTTSHTQPIDARAIHNLKTHYRRRLIQNYLIALVSKKGFFIFSMGLTSLPEIHMG